MADPELETEPQSTKPKKGKGTRARIEIEGETSRTTVDDVMETASGGKRGGATTATKATPQRFEKVIRDPNNRIIAKRISPQTTLEGEPLGDEYHDLLPHDRMTVEDIKRDLAEARGGKRWHVKVEDPDGKIIAADTITVPGEPKLEPGFEESGGGGMGGEELEPVTETMEDRLANDPEIIKARKEVELLKIKAEAEEKQAQLEEARARRVAAERVAKGLPPESAAGNGNGHKTHDEERFAKMIEQANAPLKAALAASEKALEEERARSRAREDKADRKAEQEALIAPLRQMQESQAKTLETLMQKMSQPPAPTGPGTDALLAKLDSMQVSLRSEFKDNMNTVVNGIKDGLNSKIDTLASSVNLLMAKGNDPVTTAMLQLATKSGQGGPTQQDPFTMMAKAMETMKALQAMTKNDGGAPQDFPSYLVDRVTSLAPDVMEFIKEQQMSAQVVTKEMMEAKMKELGTKMWQGLDQTIKSEIRNIRVATPALPATPTPAPASATPAGPPPPPVKPTPAPAGVGATPPPAAPSPTAAPPVAAAPAPAPTAAPVSYPFGMSKEDFIQTQKRVNHVLKVLTNEMRLGVQAMKWPEQAFAHLPKPLIDALLPAATGDEIRGIFEPFADPALMQVVAQFTADANPQHEWYRNWLTSGIEWIKDAANDQGGEGEGEPVVDEPE